MTCASCAAAPRSITSSRNSPRSRRRRSSPVVWLSTAVELAPARAEIFSEEMLEGGAESVSLESVPGAPAALEPGARMRVVALATAAADPVALVAAAAATAAMPAPGFTVAPLEEEDWVRRSQSQFGPIRISERLWIVPSWHAPPHPAAIAGRPHPGPALGTGGH